MLLRQQGKGRRKQHTRRGEDCEATSLGSHNIVSCLRDMENGESSSFEMTMHSEAPISRDQIGYSCRIGRSLFV